jgi:hypothetical protein
MTGLISTNAVSELNLSFDTMNFNHDFTPCCHPIAAELGPYHQQGPQRKAYFV